jgi:hypothetical protein
MLWACVRGNPAKVYFYREHAEHGLSPKAQAQILLNRTTPQENVMSNIIGHDAARTDVSNPGLTIQWHFQTAGVRPLKLSSRKKNASRALLQTLFDEDRIVIHPDCRKLRKQLLSYSWKETADEKPEDGNDDLVDAAHYMVELLQYRLLISASSQKEKSLDEIYKAIREEKAQKSKNRYALDRPQESHSLDVEGTAAGYF